MARIIVNGSVPSIANTFRSVATITAISNAANAVATLGAGHGTAVGDFVEILSSGWSRLVGRVFRVSAVATNDVTLEGCDTTSTTLFPAGAGTGTIRRITAWTNIAQITDFAQSGGEQQFLTYQYLDQDAQSSIPTTRTPVQVELTTHDDIALSHYAVIQAAQSTATVRAFRIVARDSKRWLGNGFWSMAPFPQFESNQVLRRTINLALSNPDVTAYSS